MPVWHPWASLTRLENLSLAYTTVSDAGLKRLMVEAVELLSHAVEGVPVVAADHALHVYEFAASVADQIEDLALGQDVHLHPRLTIARVGRGGPAEAEGPADGRRQ